MKSSNPPPVSTVDRDNPWPGLASFTEEQSAFFYGRDEEIRALARLMERKALTILFGQSGLGKSSLLQAGVFPRLRAAGFCPIYIRLDHGEGAPPPGEQVKTMVAAAAASAGTWTKPGAAKPGESLWEFFHHRDDRLVDAQGRTIVPVLVFDQFEELFTLGAAVGAQRDRAITFMGELAELVENRPSEKLVERLDRSSDEMDAFDFSRTDYRVCISLREDYLPHLEGLKTIMPALMENRMRLTQMTGTQALDAVLKPGGALVTPEVARGIVEFVAGARGGSVERLAELNVEPPLLSVICRELNERRRALGQSQITVDLVSGNRREILTDFYERSVADLPEDMRRFVEDKLLTKSGFRDNLALETALEEPGVTKPLIDTLVSRRLLRIEDRIGTQRVELTHDVLAEVIRASRDTRQQRIALEKERQRERLTRRRMWLARTIAAGLLVVCAGVSWIAWRAIRAEREQMRLRSDAETARGRERRLREQAEADELAAKRKAYASDINAVQHALAMDNLGRARVLLQRHKPAAGAPDLRGWEWRYLWQLCQSDAQTVVKEPDDIEAQSVALSADNRWAAVGSRRNGLLNVYNLRTGKSTRLPGADGWVRVAFSPREPLLAFAQTRGDAVFKLTLWNPDTEQVVREIALSGVCFNLAFTDDGASVATFTNAPATADVSAAVGEISVWRVSDGKPVATWRAGYFSGNTGFTGLAINGDASLAAVVAGGRDLVLLDLKTGQRRWRVPATVDSLKCLAFSPDGQMLASGSGFVDATIGLWEVASGKSLGKLEGQRGWTSALVFLRDGKHLLSSSADQTFRLWDLSTRTVSRTFRGHQTELHSLVLGVDQRTVLTGSKDGSAYLWKLDADRGASAAGVVLTGRGTWRFERDRNSIVFSKVDGRVVRLQGAGLQEEIPLFEMGEPAPLFRNWTLEPVMDPKRPLLAVVSATSKVQVWDWERRALVREWDAMIGGETAIPRRFLANGTKLLVTVGPVNSSNYPGAYREWDIATGRETRQLNFPGPLLPTPTEVFSPDERETVVFGFATADGFRRNLATGESVPLSLNMRQARHAIFSPDGKLCAVTSQMGYGRIFKAANFEEITTLRGFMFGVHSMEFTSDMKRIAVGSTASEAVTIWDAHNYERLLTLPAFVGVVSPIQFSPDGNVLVGQGGSGLNTGALNFWRAPSWAEIEAAERKDTGKASQ